MDIGNLRGGKTDDLVPRVISEIDIKIVKIPSGSTHDYDFFHHFRSLHLFSLSGQLTL
jgi:hypothetical protein